MEPDTAPRPLDHVERAHLRTPGDASHVMWRYDAAAEFAGLLERFWIPVWSVFPGDGWAVGVMCAPAAGALVARGSVAPYTDRSVDLADVLGDDGQRLTARVRAAMAPDPTSPAA